MTEAPKENVLQRNLEMLQEIEDNIIGDDELIALIEKYLKEIEAMRAQLSFTLEELNRIEEDLKAIEEEIKEIENSTELSLEEKERRLKELHDFKSEKQKQKQNFSEDRELISRNIQSFTKEEGIPIKQHLESLGLNSMDKDVVVINEDKIKLVKEHQEKLKEKYQEIKSKIENKSMKNKPMENKPKEDKEETKSENPKGDKEKETKPQKPEIKKEESKSRVPDSSPQYHPIVSKNYAPNTNHSKQKISSISPESYGTGKSYKEVNPIECEKPYMTHRYGLTQDQIKRYTGDKSTCRRIEGGFLHRIEINGSDITFITEDIEAVGYTKDTNAQLRKAIEEIREDIELGELSEVDKQVALERFEKAKKKVRACKSPTKRLELLLALKSGVNVEEKLQSLQGIPNGNVYNFGKNDLKEYMKDEKVGFLFKRLALKIDREELKKKREKLKEQREKRRKREKERREEKKIEKQQEKNKLKNPKRRYHLSKGNMERD